ncbi:MAG: pilus assembly protein HicB [Planctomycetota bacterium]
MKPIDRYHKWVEWSEEDQIYLGLCPDLITGIHGDDPVAVYEQLCETIQEVIDHYKAKGKPLPEPKTRPTQEVA